MTSFVEQAVLQVTDKSSKQLRAINKLLADMSKNAKSLRKINIDIPGLVTKTNQVNKLSAALHKIPKSVKVSLSVTGLNAAPTKAVDSLSKKLAAIRALKPAVLHINISQVDRAILRLDALLNRMRVVRASSPLTIPIKTQGGFGGGRGNGGGRGGAGAGGGPLNHSELSFRNFAARAQSILISRLASLTIAGPISLSVQSLIVNAAQATLVAQATTSSQNATMGQADKDLVNEAARQAVLRVEGLSLTDVRVAASDLARSIVKADNPNFLPILDSLVHGLESLEIIRPANKEQDQAALNKVLDLAQIGQDPKRADDLVNAFTDLVGSAGPLFNSTAFVNALRMSRQGTTIDGNGLFRFGVAFNDVGRSVGSDVNRLVKVLNGEMGVSSGQETALQNSGLRTTDGQAVDSELLSSNFAAWVEQNVVPLLTQKGIDIAASTIDGKKATPAEINNATSRALEDIGFVTTEARTLASVIAGTTEAALAAKVASDAAMTAQQASAKDLGASFRNLKEAADTLASEGLTPLAEFFAPYVDMLANGMERIALGEGTPQDTLLATGVGAAGITGLLGFFKAFSYLSGTSANTAATAANTAALAANTIAQSAGVGGSVAAGAATGATGWFAAGLALVKRLAVPTAALLSLSGDTQKGVEYVNGKPYDTTTPEGLAKRDAARIEFKKLVAVFNETQRHDSIATALMELADRKMQEQPLSSASTSGLGLGKPMFSNQSIPVTLPPAVLAEIAKPDSIQNALSAAVAIVTARDNISRITDQSPYPTPRPYMSPMPASSASDLYTGQRGEAGIKSHFTFPDAELTNLQTVIATPLGNGSDQLKTTFTTGANEVKASTAEAAAAFGPAAGSGILAVAAEFGAIVGQAAKAAIGNINVGATVTQTPTRTPRLDTGGSAAFGTVGPQ
jgi:hypothetical protein